MSLTNKKTLMQGKNIFFIFLMAAILFSGICGFVYFIHFTQDDVYISLRYSLNLALGNGLVFNPGEKLESYTNFLWVIMGRIGFFNFISGSIHFIITNFFPHYLDVTGYQNNFEPLLFLKFISLLSFCGVIIFSFRLSKLLIPVQNIYFHLIAPAVLAVSVQFHVWGASGLEEIFFTFLITVSFYYFIQYLGTDNKKDVILSALSVFLAFLTRPEALMPAVLFAGIFISKTVRSGKINKKDFCFYGIFGLLALIYLLWKKSYFGVILPATYLVKGGHNVFDLFLGLKYVWEFVVFDSNSILLAGVLFSLTVRTVRKDVKPGYAACAFFIFFYFLYMIKIGGDIFPLFRLFVPATVFIIILAADGVYQFHLFLQYILRNKTISSYLKNIRILFVCLVLIFIFCRYNFSLKEHTAFTKVDSDLKDAFWPVALYLNKNASAGDGVIFQDMGYIPYHNNNLRFIDVIGLCNKDLSSLIYQYKYSAYSEYLMGQQWPQKIAKYFGADSEAYSTNYATFREKATDYLKNIENVKFAIIAFTNGDINFKNKVISNTVTADEVRWNIDFYTTGSSYYYYPDNDFFKNYSFIFISQADPAYLTDLSYYLAVYKNKTKR